MGVEFRDKELGTYKKRQAGHDPSTTLSGCNLDLFEQGARSDDLVCPTLNIVYPIVKNIVPTLFFQNPKATAVPEQRSSTAGEDAFYVSELINRDLRDPMLRIKETGQLATFDGYVVAVGLVKIGYATELGPDILPTNKEKKVDIKEKLKDVVDDVLVAIGAKKPDPPEPLEPQKVGQEEAIRPGSSYIQWLSAFEFVIDPKARDIYNANWVAQLIRRTIRKVKEDRRYGSAKHDIRPESLEDDTIEESFIEDFQTVDIWEVHYKNDASPTGITILTFATTQDTNHALMHEHSVYDLGGWQYEWLVMNKHGHRLYPISTISVIRPLINRINSSLDAILEQVDKFQAKIVYNDRVTPEGEKALDDPTLGARIKLIGSESVVGAIAVVSMEQVKADLLGLINQVLDFVILITGLTRAQLTGLTTAQTATEAQIGQSGQTLRRTDEANLVAAWFNRVITKYWRVKSQFEDLTEIDLVREAGIPNAATGMTTTEFYPPIDDARAQRLKESRFRFDMEVSSMQKPNLEIVRAQFEGFMRALMEPVVTQGLALEGKRVSASEAVRQWSRFFQESGLLGLDKMLVPINDPMQQNALLNYGMKPTPQPSQNGRAMNPTHASLVSAAAGPKGQGASPA